MRGGAPRYCHAAAFAYAVATAAGAAADVLAATLAISALNTAAAAYGVFLAVCQRRDPRFT